MAEAQKKPAPSKAAAAQAEVADEKRTCEWRGLELELTQELPPTILFDLAELEASTDPMPVFRLLRSLLGPSQFAEVRNTITAEDALDEVVEELTGTIFAQYGISLGE